MEELVVSNFIILFSAGFCAGLLDSIAGGGGMISLPVLLTLGYPPHEAMGTNKLQSSFGAITSSYTYVKGGLVNLKDVWIGIIYTALGAAIGTYLLQRVPADNLKEIIPVLLVAIFFYTFFRKKLGEEDRHGRLRPHLFYLLCGLGIGFYDGFFGPGTGAFWTIAFVTMLGFNLKKATGCTKIVNATSNLVALSVFCLMGNVAYVAGLTAGIGQVIGARTGARLVLKNGVGFVRTFFLFAVGATILKLAYDTYL